MKVPKKRERKGRKGKLFYPQQEEGEKCKMLTFNVVHNLLHSVINNCRWELPVWVPKVKAMATWRFLPVDKYKI